MPHARQLRLTAGLLLLFAVSGCAGLNDPFKRAGTWYPEHDNDANLTATIANPHDLVQGANDPRSPGELSASAVRRLLADRVKPLATTTSQASAGGGSGGSGIGSGGTP
jgi:hypothetical protein